MSGVGSQELSRRDGVTPPGAASSSTTVWLSPSATSYSCLCEHCLEAARRSGEPFSDALHAASVRGTIGRDAFVVAVRCAAGHEIVLRRGDPPPALNGHDDRQLQLA
jgi:hypothetical protein